MADTNISWTDKVWNPTVGCSRVSAGCENCYAETFANRLEHMGQARYKGLTVVGKHGVRWTGEVRQVPGVLAAPLAWKKGRRIFVNSMSDLFHEAVPFEYVAAVFGAMAACPQHTFQVLTKRLERAVEFFEWLDERRDAREWVLADAYASAVSDGSSENHEAARARLSSAIEDAYRPDGSEMKWPLPNVHLGVSCEDQANADKRIPLLLQCPAAVRWISAEPLLEPLRLDRPLLVCAHWNNADGRNQPPWEPLDVTKIAWKPQALRCVNQRTLDWVVVGGESAGRMCNPAWIDLIVAQCTAAGVPVFVKQDSGPKPGRQGRLSDATWAHKEFPR